MSNCFKLEEGESLYEFKAKQTLENLKRLQEKLKNLSSSDESEDDSICIENSLPSNSINDDSVLESAKVNRKKVNNRRKRKCTENKVEYSLIVENEVNGCVAVEECSKSSSHTNISTTFNLSVTEINDSYVTETGAQNNLAVLNNSAVEDQVVRRSKRLKTTPKVSYDEEPIVISDVFADHPVTGSNTKARKKQRNNQKNIPTIVLDEEYPVSHCSFVPPKETKASLENVDERDESVDYDATSETVSVFVNWSGKDCEKFEVPRYRPLKSIFEHYAEKYNMSLSSVVLIRDWQMLNPTDSPDSLQFNCVQYLQGLKANTEQNYEKNNIPKTILVNKNDLKLKVLLQNQRPLTLTISKNQPMKVIVAKCAAQLDCPDEDVVLFLDGEKIELEDTPADLDLQNDDCVDARVKKSK